MPHKRAKRSAREELRRQRGADLAPGKESLNTEVTSKSVLRVLNAGKIREEWKLKKRRLASQKADSGGKGDARSLESPHWKILPGEPIQHFHRRVEDGMRPMIKSAIQASRATMRRNYRNDKGDTKRAVDAQPDTPRRRSKRERSASPTAQATAPDTITSAKEFAKASASVPRKLNDVAKAPPSFTALPRGTRKFEQGSKRDSLLSMAQRSLMNKEREKAIRRYRLLRANQRA